jgi:hypothetical protein
MSVFDKITTEISSGMVLYTPSRKAQFTVKSVDSKNGVITFCVGSDKLIKVPKACWNSIPSFLKDKGWVQIVAIHDKLLHGTFDEYLNSCLDKSHPSWASYVVPVLDYVKIIEVDSKRPSKVKLK